MRVQPDAGLGECVLDEPREDARVADELRLCGRVSGAKPRALWLRRARSAAWRVALDGDGGFRARVSLGATARGPLDFELWAEFTDGSERRVAARRVIVERAEPPRFGARDAAEFFRTAARKAWRAFSEGRLPASPRAWLRDLRLHFAELSESRAAMAERPRASGREALARAAAVELAEFLRGGERLHFAARDDRAAIELPAVSVLIVTFGRAELTLRCLRSLARAAEKISFELVLVDNASTDETPALFDRLDGATILRNATNEGFLRAVNQAARVARGRHLALINNDAELHPGALAAAVRRLDATPDLGAVGAKLIAPDGRLQEAGSIIWRDGSCAGAGRGAAPDDPAFDFAREVDFSSGAFLVTPRACFVELGGFDERYAPAYYEDADYCARLWRSGRRVLYDPRVAAHHFEFASSPSRAAALAMQSERRPIFVAAHADWLASQPSSGTPELRARRRPARGRRILFVDDRAPDPAYGSGHPRARAMVEALTARGHQVAVLPTRRALAGEAPLPDGVERAAGTVAEALAARAIDCVLVSRPHNLRLVLDATPDAPVIYDAEALYAARDAHVKKLSGEKISDGEIARLVDEELRLAARARAVIAVSGAEAERFGAAGAARVAVVGHSLAPSPGAPPFAARDGFLFVGAFHHDASPNSDSMRWFVREVWPRVRERLPRAALTIAGARPTAAIEALASAAECVDVLGRADELAPLYDHARAFVAPTRFGAGLPYKIHHAAAHGLPAVATSLVAAQLGWRDELLIANDPAAFAEACVRLHGDEATWNGLRARALDRVARDCDPRAFGDALDRIVREA